MAINSPNPNEMNTSRLLELLRFTAEGTCTCADDGPLCRACEAAALLNDFAEQARAFYEEEYPPALLRALRLAREQGIDEEGR